jgi:hypothetical protein
LTTPESDDQGKTAPIDLPPIPPAPPPSRARKSATPRPTDDAGTKVAPEPATVAAEEPPPAVDEPPIQPPVAVTNSAVVDAPVVVRAASRLEQETLFVPLAVSVGDGFKFGCGFFLALVLAMLIGFVLFAALFVLTNLFGLNLPISR